MVNNLISQYLKNIKYVSSLRTLIISIYDNQETLIISTYDD